MQFLRPLLLVLCLVSSFNVHSAGVSPYLPLNVDSLVELDIHRLSAVAKMPLLSKPYPIMTVANYLEKVKSTYPVLYRRLNNYIERYKSNSAITGFSAELGISGGQKLTLENKRGAATDNAYQLRFGGFNQINQYLIVNGGGTLVDGEGFIPHNSFLSFGYEYIQFDIGYREHWLSPSPIAAPLLSTNAAPSASITVSNVTPITDWNLRYEISMSLLEEVDGIHFDDKISSGKPGLLTMHFSAQPFDWWTIGANRVFMFGGGERSIDASDIWNAIIDPVNSDNCGGDGTDLVDCDLEVGNQIASISNKFDLSYGQFPFSLYVEVAGEDTKGHSNFQLGNVSHTTGIFLPYLTENIAAYIEFSDFQDFWYIHHLYDEGYTNEGNIMGHWWAEQKHAKDSAGATMLSVKLDWDINTQSHLETVFRAVKPDPVHLASNRSGPALDPSDFAAYKDSQQLELNYKHAYKSGFVGLSLKGGNDSFGQSFYRVSVSYNW